MNKTIKCDIEETGLFANSNVLLLLRDILFKVIN